MSYKEITLYPTTPTSSTSLLDLVIKDGDFTITESSQQEVDLLLNVFPGNYFQYPKLGIGIISRLAGSEPTLKIEVDIASAMKADGFIVDSINVNGSGIANTTINIEAHRP